jgi:hypothetical protein
MPETYQPGAHFKLVLRLQIGRGRRRRRRNSSGFNGVWISATVNRALHAAPRAWWPSERASLTPQQRNEQVEAYVFANPHPVNPKF